VPLYMICAVHRLIIHSLTRFQTCKIYAEAVDNRYRRKERTVTVLVTMASHYNRNTAYGLTLCPFRLLGRGVTAAPTVWCAYMA
jgi:hypothetical protein